MLAATVAAPSARLATRRVSGCALQLQQISGLVSPQQLDRPSCSGRGLAMANRVQQELARAAPLSCCRDPRPGMGLKRTRFSTAASGATPAGPLHQQGRGALIVFEGIDRCGKSTHTALLAKHLRAQGVSQLAPGVEHASGQAALRMHEALLHGGCIGRSRNPHATARPHTRRHTISLLWAAGTHTSAACAGLTHARRLR
jgi:hypothetical protein